MKQTAVEWLADRIMPMIPFHTLEYRNNFIKFIEQAKEMERDQLIMFGTQCMVEVEKESGLGSIKIYELYFGKTFKPE